MRDSRSHLWSARIGALLALLMVISACGADADTGTQVVTTEVAATSAPMDDTAMDEDMADENMAMDDGDMEDMDHDAEHEHGETREWVGEVPTIDVAVTGDAASGWDVTAVISGDFTFTDADTLTHVDGQGHVHLIVDGRVLAMSYNHDMHIDELTPGDHVVEITLASNDHADYVVGDDVIGGTAELTVEGAVEDADVTVEIEIVDGVVAGDLGRVAVPIGSLVELRVVSDVADEVHVHGYDIYADAESGSEATLRFTADIPGVFEVELENSQLLVVELEVS